MQNAFAQTDVLTEGIKDNPGSWWVGEGLKKGDQFSYRMCHVDFRECSDFEMNIWIEGDISVGTETKWLVQTVVYDRIYVITGTMELGKIAPEPTGGSAILSKYRGAFKTSIIWLSAFANANEPKEFSRPSWGKIANIGGQQIIPQEMQTITVPAGTYETALIAWKTGGQTSRVWVLDEFPFPIKGDTFTHVSEGIPPPEYQFELLDYKENVQTNPFAGIEAKLPDVIKEGCPKLYDLVDIKRTSVNYAYLLEVKYGPKNPLSGCAIEWFINFKKPADQTEFLNQVQYDIWLVDDDFTIPPLRSIANEEGSDFLYSPSGQVHRNTFVTENAGTSHYVIWIYGLSPKFVVPIVAPDYLQIDIPLSGSYTPTPTPTLKPEPKPVPEPTCRPGTVLKNGICVVDQQGNGGGCLIATATYGSELAPQVQFLREIRDNTVLSTSSGTSFMNSFNQFYYSFSPTIADWERQNPVFKEATKLFITPMISSLSIMTLADNGSETEVLAFGISVIALNLGMYIVAPTAFAYKVHKHCKSRK